MGSWIGKTFIVLVILAVAGAAVYGFFWSIKALDTVAIDDTRPAGPSFFSLNPASQKALETLNLCIIRREIARLTKDEEALEKVELAAAQALNLLNAALLKEKETRRGGQLLPCDAILMVDDKNATADLLRELFSEISAESAFNAVIQRGDHRVEVALGFKNPSGLGAAAVEVPQRMPIPDVIRQAVHRDFLSASETYQELHLAEADLQRLKRLLKEGAGTPEDYLFLKRRVLDHAAAAIKEEQNGFRALIATIEKEIADLYGPDHIVLLQKNGDCTEGALLADEETFLRVNTLAGEVEVQRDDLLKKLTHAQIKNNLAFKFSEIDINLDAVGKALLWAKEWNLPRHERLLGLHTLLRNPNHEAARAAAGYRRDKDGPWILSPTPPGLPTSEEDLRSYMERQGLSLKDGYWFKKAPWIVRLNSLYDPFPFKVNFTKAGLLERPENYTPLRAADGEKLPTNSRMERFIGALSSPTQIGSRGTVTIEIEAPSVIASCHLKANGCVITKTGLLTGDEHLSSITVSVEAEGRKPAVVYSVKNLADNAFHDITQQVKGVRRFTVKAQIENLPDKYGVYARFLNSLPNTKDVFVVDARVLVPAPDADKLWTTRR